MKKKLLALSLFVSHFWLCGQNVEFEKGNFPGKKEELKEAIRKLDLGTDLYNLGRKDFDERKRNFLIDNKYLPQSMHDFEKAGNQHFRSALPHLLDASRFNPQNATLNFMLGFIYLFNDPLKPETISYLEKANSLGGIVDPEAPFWLAWAYQLHSRWDEAIKYYDGYRKTINPKPKNNIPLLEDLDKKIAECNVGKSLSQKPERVFVDNLGPNINTGYPEYGPSISTDEEKIFFTSRRSNSLGGKKDPSDNGYFEDVYFSTKVKGKWQPAKPLSKNVNTEGHDAVAGLTPDGSKLYVYRFGAADGGDIYESVLFGLDWEQPERMNKNINTRYHESTVSLSFDGKRIFFISRRESGFGSSDIYYSDMDVNGEWGPSKNLGPEINTKYAEDAVFIHPDGVTMYFSSKGHGTMGGYDVFKSTMINGKWQAPVNLGYPINGPDDDVFFVVSGSGNRAYFSSAKAGGAGEHDLYKITFLGPEKQPLLNTLDQLISIKANPVSNLKIEGEIEVKSARVTILKGVVRDEKSQKPLEATIEMIDNEKNEILATFKSNSSTGKYLVTLPSGKNYGIAVKVQGYLFHSENFLLPAAAEFQEFVLDFEMKKLEVGNIVVLRNIFFDSDKAEIKSESENELATLVRLLKENPAIRIEVSSHTDDVGPEDYNMKLSENRSRAVISYLNGKGISSSRLVAKGYGESVPIDKNDTEGGRQNNRRTEFKILSK
jgi:outer membrane protein OmpA-like peptidoglycan-associated protein/tetratricopeptide (TPR) repeat protein